MDKIIYPAGAVIAFVALVFKLVGSPRSLSSPATRALTMTIGAVTAAFLFATPWVYTGFDALVGVPNLARLMTHISVMTLSVTVQRWLLFCVYDPKDVRRNGRVRLAIFSVSVTAMAVLFGLAPVDDETLEFSVRYGDAPYIGAYMLVYLTFFGVTFFDVARLCWRYAQLANRPFLRPGLRVSALGALFGVGYSLEKGFYILCRNLDVTPYSASVKEALSPLLGGGGAILVVAGVSLPALGTRVTASMRTLRQLHAYHQLRPLWLDLYRVLPEIALEHSARTGVTAAARDIDYRLLRRVVEIRDARLALRRYLDAGIAATAQLLGGQAGLTGDDLQAVVEAAVLASAVRAKHADTPAADTYPGGIEGGENLAGETACLVRVARAYARSPIVRAAVGRQAQPQ